MQRPELLFGSCEFAVQDVIDIFDPSNIVPDPQPLPLIFL